MARGAIHHRRHGRGLSRLGRKVPGARGDFSAVRLRRSRIVYVDRRVIELELRRGGICWSYQATNVTPLLSLVNCGWLPCSMNTPSLGDFLGDSNNLFPSVPP